jgi:hypothetical protein
VLCTLERFGDSLLVGQPDIARDDAALSKAAGCPDDLKVSRLIASDLRRLKGTQPTLRDRIDQYLAEHLERRPEPARASRN